jgi:hypothetical protein
VVQTSTRNALRLRSALRTEDKRVGSANIATPALDVLEQLSTVGEARASSETIELGLRIR